MEHLAAICFACRIGWNDSHAACYFNLFFRILPETLFNENLSFVQTHARPQFRCHSPYEQCWLRSSVLETAYAVFEETATGWRKDASEFWKHLLPAFLSRLELFHYGMPPAFKFLSGTFSELIQWTSLRSHSKSCDLPGQHELSTSPS